MGNNECLGWVLKRNPDFWEKNGFKKINSSNHHYFGCDIAKANHHPIFRKQWYIDHDAEEEAAVEVFSCDIGSVNHYYIIAIYRWNNAGYTGFPLRNVQQFSTISEYNKIIEEWGLGHSEDGYTFYISDL